MKSERRSFLTYFRGGATALALAGAGVTQKADAQVKPTKHWEPTHHDKDDWLERTSGKHRVVFDTTTADGFGEALLFITNYMATNRNEYGLANKDLSVLIVARHRAAAFGYNDAMWAKYSGPISARALFTDPKTKEPPKANLFSAQGYGSLLANNGAEWPALVTQGVQIAVCSSATRAYSAMIAEAAGITQPAAFTELTTNLVSNASMVPAGIVTVTRAQERGYSLVRT